jgi:hypothetical protein
MASMFLTDDEWIALPLIYIVLKPESQNSNFPSRARLALVSGDMAPDGVSTSQEL